MIDQTAPEPIITGAVIDRMRRRSRAQRIAAYAIMAAAVGSFLATFGTSGHASRDLGNLAGFALAVSIFAMAFITSGTVFGARLRSHIPGDLTSGMALLLQISAVVALALRVWTVTQGR